MNRLHQLWKKGLSSAALTLLAMGLVLVSISCEDMDTMTAGLGGRPMHVVGDELVQNGDFSSGTTGWFLGKWGEHLPDTWRTAIMWSA